MRVEAYGIRDGLGRRRAAFTLIEILVVVAIIALLISILLPSLSTAREHARSSACAANINEICTGEQEYESQSDVNLRRIQVCRGRAAVPGGDTSGRRPRGRLGAEAFLPLVGDEFVDAVGGMFR